MDETKDERSGRRRVMLGIAAGLLATATLIAVGVGSYRAGERRSDSIDVIGESVSEGGRTIIVDGDGWRHGPGFGFLLFPLIIGGLILLFASRRRRWDGPGWHRGRELEEWHRQAHADDPKPG